MIQKTHQQQVHDNAMVDSGIGRVLVTILRGSFTIIRKIITNIAFGFNIFVDSAEHHGLPRN